MVIIMANKLHRLKKILFGEKVNVQIVSVEVAREIFSDPASATSSVLDSNGHASSTSIEPGVSEAPSINGRWSGSGPTKDDLQIEIKAAVEDIMNNNDQLFIKPWKIHAKEQIKIFGAPVESVNEVLCESGTRILFIGKQTFWKPYFNLREAPPDKELQRYQFCSSGGRQLLQCAMYSNMMIVTMGDEHIGKLVFNNGSALDCEEWEVGAMTVEDDCGDQVFRLEKVKRHFEVLLFPELLKICTIHNYWSHQEFPFLVEVNRLIFGVPLPDDLSWNKRALLFASSFYIYEKYYHRGKIGRILLSVFVLAALLSILIFLILYKLGKFESHD